MNFDDNEFIYRIGKLSLGPNDVVLIMTDLMLDKEQVTFVRERVHDQLKAAGFDNKVLILTSGFKLQIVEKEDEQALIG
jgi:hypothetical protein